MYSCFSRLIVFSVLITIIVIPTRIVHAEESFPQQKIEQPQQLDEFVVSSTRLPTVQEDIHAVPAKITVMTAQQIEQSGARTVQEAIEKATGIVMYDQVGNAFEQTVDLRGFNGQPVTGTSVFVDGVRVNEPSFNVVNFDLIPLGTIERIEIVPGASAIYGKNALGGAINIITKRGADVPQMTGESAFGSFDRQRYSLNTSGPLGKLDYYANFSREAEEGFRDDSDASIWRFFWKIGYRPTDQTDMTVSYTYVKDNLEQAGTLPISLAEVSPDQNFTPGDFFDKEDNFLRLNGRHEFPHGLSVSANVFYRRFQQESFIKGQTSESRRLFDVESWGGAVQFSHDMEFHDHRNVLVVESEFTRNDFGDDFLWFFFSFPNFPTRTMTSTDEDIVSFYAQDTLHLGSHLVLSGGVRYDHDQFNFIDNMAPTNNASKRFNRVTPRAGITVLLDPTMSVYFNYSEGFRVPTVEELFTSRGTFGMSDPNLKPVRSRNYEVGLKAKMGNWGEGVLTFFHSDVEDEIFTSCGDPSCFPVASNQNVDKTRRRGIETTITAKYNQNFDGIINYTFAEATFETALTRNPFFDVANGVPFIVNIQEGDTIPLVPKHRLSVTGNYHPSPGWTFSLTGLYVSTQFLLGDEGNARERLPSYFVLNGRASYERPVSGGLLKGFFTINNMLNHEYSTFGIFASNVVTGGGAAERFVMPAPSLSAFGGLSYRFESFPGL